MDKMFEYLFLFLEGGCIAVYKKDPEFGYKYIDIKCG